jgi:hypothetical protein
MRYDITPFDCIGLIKLGMQLEEAHSILGDEGVLKNKSDFTDVEVWLNKGIRVSYENNICSNIECIPPAQLYFNEINLFELTCSEIFKLFRPYENKVYSDGSALLFLNISLAFNFDEISLNIRPSLLAVFPKQTFEDYLDLYSEIDEIV